MALDSTGKQVSYGDVLFVTIESLGTKVVTVVKISESAKGVKVDGAYVDLSDGVRTKKVPVDVSKARLVVRANGEEVAP